MTFAPKPLVELQHYLAAQSGMKLSRFGIVGDDDHVNGGYSYHLGSDDLRKKPAPYSVVTRRDKAGLSEAASALDIGNHKDLRELSVWLVKQAQRNAPGTSDIREIIYSPDGKVVWRWDRERGYASAPRKGEADDTHLWHTHISWYRDSQARDKVLVFRPYYEPEAIVRKTKRRAGPIGSIVPRQPNIGYAYLDLRLDKTEPATFTAPRDGAIPVTLDPPLAGGKPGANRADGYLWVGSSAKFMLATDVDFTPDAETDCAPAVAAAATKAHDDTKAAAIQAVSAI